MVGTLPRVNNMKWQQDKLKEQGVHKKLYDML